MSTEKITIGIGFGVLSEPIDKQLRKQGFKFDKDKIAIYVKEVEAINVLRFGSGLLTDAMTSKLTKKLYGKIIRHVAAKNKLTINK